MIIYHQKHYYSPSIRNSFTSPGVIKTSNTIDYERTKKYEIQVTASDKGSPKRTSRSKVTINVQDLNDNKPTFQQQTVSIPEEQSPMEVTKLTAQDADSSSNGEVMFSLLTRNTPFSISPDGVIKTTKKLDRESIDSYRLTIKVTDKGTNPSSLSSVNYVNIKVEDINDNTPAFRGSYKCKVNENMPSHSPVCNVETIDADIGKNGLVTVTTQSSDFEVIKVSFFVIFLYNGDSLLCN